MPTFVQDVRFALRTLRRSAGLTFVIVASLGIGIGANTAMIASSIPALRATRVDPVVALRDE